MISSNQSIYREVCKARNLPLYAQDWWWDAVVGKNSWDAVVIQENGEIRAAMPYCISIKKRIFRYITLPPLTKMAHLNIFYREEEITQYKKHTFDNDIVSKLLHRLPSHHFLKLNLGYEIDSILPFAWCGYIIQPRIHYILDNTNPEIIFREMRKQTRKDIRNAENVLELSTTVDINIMFEILLQTFKRQKYTPDFNLEFLKRLDSALAVREKRKIYIASLNDKPIACLYLMFHNGSALSLISAMDYNYRKYAAVNFLHWKAILAHFEKGGIEFDFQASMHPGIEPARRAYGGKQRVYYEITKVNSPILKLWYLLKGGSVLPP